MPGSLAAITKSCTEVSEDARRLPLVEINLVYHFCLITNLVRAVKILNIMNRAFIHRTT